MISFVTLLLGISIGVLPVEVRADPAVAAVELRLDGRTLLVLEAPPWKTLVDFGPPMPRELVAIARGRDGAELGRAVQLVNLRSSLAEASFTLLPGTGGRGRIASLSWASALSAKPESIELTLDGRPLDPGNLARIRLPDFRPADVHVLRAVLEFKEGSRASAELLVGGVRREAPQGPETMRGETQAELTAVPVVFRGRPPKESDMDGWFLANGGPVRVEAVEESPGEIVVVKDERAGSWIARLAGQTSARRSYSDPRLRPGQRLRFCWPGLLRPGDTAPGYEVFLRTPDYVGNWDVRKLLVDAEPPEFDGPPRPGDAVAVAAVSAASGNRPRAVLLLVAGPDDESVTPPEQTRAYLRALHVPLFVWAKNRRMASAWGKVDVLSSGDTLTYAAERLAKAVEKQRIVWLEGRHLPQSISLSPEARRVTLVE